MNIDFAHRILNSLDNGIFIIDKDLKILFWNAWLEIHTKYPAKDTVEKKLTDIYPNMKVSSLKRKIKTALALNTPSFYSAQTSEPLFVIQRPHISNTVFNEMKQDITISPYNTELGLVCVNIVDQTQLFEANYKLSTTADFKSDFLANMSHEIRTPMNAILGFVEQLAKSETDPSRMEQFNIIKRSGHSLLTIINDILDLSKIESGKFELNLRSCDIEETLEEISHLYNDLAKQKGISLTCTLTSDIPLYLILDATRTKQIIYNLLSNAIKFTEKNGAVTLEIGFNPQDRELNVKVYDTGIGIAEHNISKIFNAFEQEDVSTSEHFGGTGLGLSISSKLIQLMKGKIGVSSELAKGSCFYFSIPVTITSDSPEDLNQNKSKQGLRTKGVKVLVVEDNKTNQILMGIILDEFSLDYEIANNGLEAVEMFKSNLYNIILMDENMPHLSGEQATIQIRELEIKLERKKIPIIAVTANALEEDKQRLKSAGMNDVISKPYTEQEIKNMFIKFLD